MWDTSAMYVMADTGATWYAATYLILGCMLEWMRTARHMFSPKYVSLKPSSRAGTTMVSISAGSIAGVLPGSLATVALCLLRS